MPILGIIASSKLSAVGDFESIATVTVGGTSITFSSIPSTYTHLQIRILVSGPANNPAL
jgi:N-methylhydantoinase A/oxoprolinase/acetone carboxylase beta subunit